MRRFQEGLSSVELALVSPFFFLLLFGLIEVARAGYIWNTLDTVTRRAARVAAVCPPGHNAIFNVSLFGSADGSQMPALLKGFSRENLQIVYLDGDFNDTGGDFPIAFVRVSINNYQHQLLIPGMDKLLTVPAFSTTLPAESLGYDPSVADRRCFGTTS